MYGHMSEAFILMDIPGIKPRTITEVVFIEKEQEVVFGVPPEHEKRSILG